MNLERSDYQVKLPKGCTIHLSKEVDADHYTSVHLPNENVLVIIVIDDKAGGDEAFHDLIENTKGETKEFKEVASDTFNACQGKATVLTKKVNGINFCFEIGLMSGKHKAFLMECTYRQSEPDETRRILEKHRFFHY